MSQPQTKQKKPDPPKKQFKDILTWFASMHGRTPRDVMRDFVTLAALSIVQRFQFTQEREDRYLHIIKSYSTLEQRNKFPELLALYTLILEDDPICDFIGDIFGEFNCFNDARGQFMTPWHVSLLMAQMSIPQSTYFRKEFITIGDCACGTGTNLVAAGEVVKSYGKLPHLHLYLDAQDVDPIMAYACYVRLSLLGYAARVHVGDTLAMERMETLQTPIYYLYMWDYKLQRGGDLPASYEDNWFEFAGACLRAMQQRMKDA